MDDSPERAPNHGDDDAAAIPPEILRQEGSLLLGLLCGLFFSVIALFVAWRTDARPRTKMGVSIGVFGGPIDATASFGEGAPREAALAFIESLQRMDALYTRSAPIHLELVVRIDPRRAGDRGRHRR